MALSITGKQFVKITDSKAYVISGIPSGYTLGNVIMPIGWIPTAIGAISAGSQTLTFTVGIGSGTLGISYIKTGSQTQTIYYDVYVGATRMGEELKQDGCILIHPATSTPVSPFPAPNCGTDDIYMQSTDCLFKLDVFADANNPTTDLVNDKSDFYYFDSPAVSNKTMFLQKNANNCGSCVWNDVTVISGSALGKYFAYGYAPDFSGNTFVDDYGKKYTGVLLNWIAVLNAYGEGEYRMKITSTNAFTGATSDTYDVRIFCLHQKNDYNMDWSVRIETINSGLRGTLNDNSTQIDYYTSWVGQIRLKGIFYETKPNYNKDFNQYGDADFNALKPIIHELSPKFTMDIKPAPGWVDWLLENYVLLSDQILVTDYNSSNRKTFIKTPVINENGIETKDDVFMNQLAWSQISFSYGQNNLRKRNS